MTKITSATSVNITRGLQMKICDGCGLIHSKEFDGICPIEFEEYKRKEREEDF